MVFLVRNQRTMDIHRDIPSKGLIQAVIFGGGRKVLVSSYHMGNSHQMVVYYIGKIISGITVGLDQYHIVQFCIVHSNIPINLILESRCSFRRVILADHIRNTGSQFFFYFFFGQMQTMFVVYIDFFSGHSSV